VLSAAGSSMDDVVKTTILLRECRRLRSPQRGLRSAHARSTAGAVSPGQRSTASRPAGLNRGDRGATELLDRSLAAAVTLGRRPTEPDDHCDARNADRSTTTRRTSGPRVAKPACSA
jgi:hypothetical protein